MPAGRSEGRGRAEDAAQERRARRYFTPTEANALLPTLEQQLVTLQEQYRRARESYHELRKLEAVGRKEDGSLIMAYDHRQARAEFEHLVAHVNRLIGEITDHGCQLKHIELGLVDFPSILAGQEVLLCWRQGEPMVAYYHGFEDGYDGRRPIPPEHG